MTYRIEHDTEPSLRSYWHKVNENRSNEIFHQFSNMCVLIFVLIQNINHTAEIKNTCKKRHGHLRRFEALLIHVLPSVHYLLIQLIICFLLTNPTLLHVAFNCWCNMPSFLLKLHKKKSEENQGYIELELVQHNMKQHKWCNTSWETLSSMRLQMTDEALTILGSLKTQSKASFVAISPMPTKDVVMSIE